MAIVINCPICGVRLSLTEDRAGTTMDCPKCDAKLLVPGTKPPPMPARLPLVPTQTIATTSEEDDDNQSDDGARNVKKSNALGIASMSCGITSVVITLGLCVVSYGTLAIIGSLIGIAGLITARMARKRDEFDGFAVTGYVTSLISVILGTVALLAVFTCLAGYIGLIMPKAQDEKIIPQRRVFLEVDNYGETKPTIDHNVLPAQP